MDTVHAGPVEAGRVPERPDATLRLYHEALDAEFRRTLEGRVRSVWDARRLLARFRGQRVAVRVDDGQFGAARLVGIFETVVHRPEVGFSLVLRGLLPTADPAARRRAPGRRVRTALPLALVRELPDGFAFLREPLERWPAPPALAPCRHVGCAGAGTPGRFCPTCGHLARRRTGAVGEHALGEGFAAWQRLLAGMRDAGDHHVRACGCGALGLATDSYCLKCARPVGEGVAPIHARAARHAPSRTADLDPVPLATTPSP